MERTSESRLRTTSTVVRRACEQDIGTLTELLGQLFAIERDFEVQPENQRRGLHLLLHAPESRLLVAEHHGMVVGMCSVQCVVSTAAGGKSGWVEDVVVHRDFRGMGIGRQLMNAIRQAAQQMGAVRLQLLADVQNREALEFYRHLGWRGTQLLALRLEQE